MSIIEGANAVSEAGTTKTTGSKHGNYLDKHCFTGSCNGKKFSGANANTHLKKHLDEDGEKKMEKCDGD